MTRLLLLRHGRTEWNRDSRFRGRADVPLDSVGRDQADALARRIASAWAPTAVYSSPLARSLATAEAVARRFGLGVCREDRLVDLDHGEWQGLTVPEARARWPALLAAWRSSPETVRPPGGESLQELRARAAAAVARLARQHADETIVVVGHDAVNRVILLEALGLPDACYWRIGQHEAALNVIEGEPGAFSVLALNDTGHLPADADNG
jgi:broad specificity phosphatase PhoE